MRTNGSKYELFGTANIIRIERETNKMKQNKEINRDRGFLKRHHCVIHSGNMKFSKLSPRLT